MPSVIPSLLVAYGGDTGLMRFTSSSQAKLPHDKSSGVESASITNRNPLVLNSYTYDIKDKE